MFDLHTHLMPEVDDGAESVDASLAALRAMAAQGVEGAIATPHLSGSLTLRPHALEARLAELDSAWRGLQALTATGVRVERGSEVMLDTPRPDLSDPRVRLAGTAFVLVEFAGMLVPPASADALAGIVASGLTPVVAHPERYLPASSSSAVMETWKGEGATLQVNCGSVVGRFGEGPARTALRLLEAGLVDYLASDYHCRGTPPIQACREWFAERGGTEQWELLTSENPGRLARGLSPLSVPGLAAGDRKKRRLWFLR